MDFRSSIQKVFGPYSRKTDKRFHVVVFMKSGKKRTVSYPKFLAEFLLNRILDPHKETVDHINGDFTDNSWKNMRVVTRGKHISEDVLKAKKHSLTCVWCGTPVTRTASQFNHVPGKTLKPGPFCSKTCTGEYGSALRSGKVDPLPVRKPLPFLYKTPKKLGGLKLDSLPESKIWNEKRILGKFR